MFYALSVSSWEPRSARRAGQTSKYRVACSVVATSRGSYLRKQRWLTGWDCDGFRALRDKHTCINQQCSTRVVKREASATGGVIQEVVVAATSLGCRFVRVGKAHASRLRL